MGLRTKHNEASALVAQMTVEEKASLCSGRSFWRLKPIKRLGVPSVMVTDGPHGLRKQTQSADHVGLNRSVPATCFPTASALASTWNDGLLREIGEALGQQCVAEDVTVLLGPGLNIKRHPLCGRNFEYFSEDPLLTGRLAAAMIQGVQANGVGTSIKHYAVNNQELGRMTTDAIVDQRALREIYLPAFEICVREAQPWTVMCAYNRVNGPYCGEHDQLLNRILRDEWGFEGLVVSDWGATNDRVLGVTNGLDLEMPASGGANDRKIVRAVENGTLNETDLDRVATRITSLALLGGDLQPESVVLDHVAAHQLARRAACEGAVLLKNAGDLLPISKTTPVAAIGAFAKTPRYQGTGSSQVTPTELSSAWDALQEAVGERATYAPGYDPKTAEDDPSLIEEAAALAAQSEVALLFVGLPSLYESEGFDRSHMRLPDQHVRLIEAVGAANPNTVVVLSNGAPVEMPWIDHPAAVLEMYLSGQAGGLAAVDLIYGDANPSGRLAETFPHSQTDVPADAWFPGNHKQVQYREGLYVGYRYYDSFDVDVLFPFGHGLSYTTFDYDNLDVAATFDATAGENLEVRLSVTNSGERDGLETVQLYVKPPAGEPYRPDVALRAFKKLFLRVGEIAEVELLLSRRDFAIWDQGAESWHVPAGRYEICVGASSRDIRVRAPIDISSPDELSSAARVPGPTFENDRLSIPDDTFADMLGGPVPDPDPVRPFHLNSTLTDIAESALGRMFRDRAMAQFQQQMGGASNDETLTKMFEEMAINMPLRGLTLFSGGALSGEHVQALVHALNGRYFKALRTYLSARK